jgi:hypothetical protein
MTPMLLISSCAIGINSAICDGTQSARNDLNVALLEDGGPQSKVAGASLLSLMDVGCAAGR